MERMNGFMNSWMAHRNALIELVKTVGDEHLNYKPWEDAMSFSELVLHITSATEMFVQTVKRGVFTPPTEKKSVDSINELLSTIQSETEQTKAGLESLTNEQLEQIVEFAGMKMPGMVMLESGKDHEIHHKGQLFTYARLIGVKELPFFISRG
ncbi:DinB family protein [Bacillus sp. Marseille-P3661]|uniref:DinB family protein n=1 Tax=Bacillus sp. Marseille-P3661 TaxID=1936234 RepID=UPI000C853201|nr:DinB family protein [Bacillus sp. Marseille-P3661]